MSVMTQPGQTELMRTDESANSFANSAVIAFSAIFEAWYAGQMSFFDGRVRISQVAE